MEQETEQPTNELPLSNITDENGDSLLSEHFKTSEFACKHCGLYYVDPALVNALESIRRRVGKPVIINDAFRCIEHNESVGGAKNSQHLLGKAADIRIEGYTGRDLYNITESSKLFNGIGRDDFHNYVHVDIREHGLVRWCYDATGKVIPYHD